MVIFKNITFDKNWVEADAEVRTSQGKDCFHVKINRDRQKDQIIYNPKHGDTFHLCMACWNLLRDIDSNKVKQNSQVEIMWG